MSGNDRSADKKKSNPLVEIATLRKGQKALCARCQGLVQSDSLVVSVNSIGFCVPCAFEVVAELDK